MSELTRRRFCLKACSTVASSVLLRGAALAAAQPAMHFPTDPRARLAVASWPFRAYIDSPTNKWARDTKLPGMDLKDFGAMVVQRFNVNNVEPLDSHFRSTEPAYLEEFREAVEKAGAHVINLPIQGHNSYYDPDSARRKAAVAYGKKWIDIARKLGSPSIRTHIAGAHGVTPDADRAAESLKQVADDGAEKSVVVNVENDDLETEDAFFLVKVIEKANHPWLHALPDFCNSMLGGDPDFNYRAVTAMFRHAYNISHVKDSEADDKKVVTVDVARTFGIAKAAGYRGYFSMEFEGAGDPYNGTQKLIDESLKNLA